MVPCHSSTRICQWIRKIKWGLTLKYLLAPKYIRDQDLNLKSWIGIYEFIHSTDVHWAFNVPGTGDVLENKLQMFPFIWSFCSSEERQRESKCTSKHLISEVISAMKKNKAGQKTVCVCLKNGGALLWRGLSMKASLNKNWVRSRCKSLQKSCSSGQNSKYKGPVTRVCVGWMRKSKEVKKEVALGHTGVSAHRGPLPHYGF